MKREHIIAVSIFSLILSLSVGIMSLKKYLYLNNLNDTKEKLVYAFEIVRHGARAPLI